ncbi:MAG: hypothetical protein OEW27_12160 [Aquincola sp.]|nr:hypothetical protein [Aquincola sp.]
MFFVIVVVMAGAPFCRAEACRIELGAEVEHCGLHRIGIGGREDGELVLEALHGGQLFRRQIVRPVIAAVGDSQRHLELLDQRTDIGTELAAKVIELALQFCAPRVQLGPLLGCQAGCAGRCHTRRHEAAFHLGAAVVFLLALQQQQAGDGGALVGPVGEGG